MPREIKTHHVDELNQAISIKVGTACGRGGAPLAYRVEVENVEGDSYEIVNSVYLKFHEGPVDEGFNGITSEALLAVLIDRLMCLKAGPYPDEFYTTAIKYLILAHGNLVKSHCEASGTEEARQLDSKEHVNG